MCVVCCNRFMLHFLGNICADLFVSIHPLPPLLFTPPSPPATLSWSQTCSAPSCSTTSPLQCQISRTPSQRESSTSFSPDCCKAQHQGCSWESRMTSTEPGQGRRSGVLVLDFFIALHLVATYLMQGAGGCVCAHAHYFVLYQRRPHPSVGVHCDWSH